MIGYVCRVWVPIEGRHNTSGYKGVKGKREGWNGFVSCCAAVGRHVAIVRVCKATKALCNLSRYNTTSCETFIRNIRKAHACHQADGTTTGYSLITDPGKGIVTGN